MHSSQSSQNLSHRKNYQLICECLDETNKRGKEKVAEKLKNHGGKLAQLSRWILLKPIISIPILYIAVAIICVFIFFITAYFAIAALIRVILFSFLFVLHLAAPIVLYQWNVSKLEMEWDERWGKAIGNYLSKTNLSPIQAERRIKRTTLHYSRKGRPISLIVNLLGGGIFIGCLPDPAFQKVLITLSLPEIFEVNPFGASCIVILPFIYFYYLIKYYLPVAWMEQLAIQIELEGLDD